MVDSVQQGCKNPFDYIENIKALDPNKIYFINMSFEDNPGFEYRCKMAEALQRAFHAYDIAVIINPGPYGCKVDFVQENSEND